MSQTRSRSAVSPVRSVVSSTPAEAGRADERAVAAGEAALGDLVPARCSRFGEQVAGCRWCRASGPCFAPRARRAASRRPRSAASASAGAAARPGPRRRARCRPRRGSGARRRGSRSARGRSRPRAFGPVPIEAQKQVPAGSKQLTATTNALAARRVVAVGVAAAEEHAVLDRDRVQLARAHAEERERRVVGGSSSTSKPRRCGAPARAAPAAGSRNRFHECGPTA